jgi:alpha-glucosidase
MYFNKIDHPLNFAPTQGLRIENPGQSLFRLCCRDERWEDMSGLVDIQAPPAGQAVEPGPVTCIASGEGGIALIGTKGRDLLCSHAGVPFGVCGNKWLMSFRLMPGMRFFGMGEKNTGFEKTGMRTKFWNTDVWADFHTDQVENGSTDPMYASFPVLLVKHGTHWIGILVASNYPVFMDTGARQVIEGLQDPGVSDNYFYFGAIDGMPDVYLTADTEVQTVVRTLARLCGLPERPPFWALGYQQSRWGYKSLADLEGLDKEFRSQGVPCDGLWLDIDYMDGFRVFSLATEGFDNAEARIGKLNAKGRKIVPILDPGVKRDMEYRIAAEGLEKGLFCLNRQGLPYTGFVWPGASLFPDFAQEGCRAWWAGHTAALCAKGFNAFWVDMNDPSTGSSAIEEMLFNKGRMEHEAFHNVYGRAMTEATRDGLREAYPDKRPFVLSRSGFLGSSRSGALWCGDNVSNYHHLQKGVEMMLSLSLSGMAYNGNDLGGFGGDCSDELFLDWHRANLLFPVYRNHSATGTRLQEPWRFSEATGAAVRQTILIRYSLLPYLYNLMISLSLDGSPVIRPLLWEDDSAECLAIADQFLIGDGLLQAPKLVEGQQERDVYFPQGDWISLGTGTEYHGPVRARIDLLADPLALFLRSGVLVPLVSVEKPVHHSGELDTRDVVFLLYPGSGQKGSAPGAFSYDYHFDSGDGYDYRRNYVPDDLSGQRSGGITTLSGSVTEAGVSIEAHASATISLRFAVLGGPKRLEVNGSECSLARSTIPTPGLDAPVWSSEALVLPESPA